MMIRRFLDYLRYERNFSEETMLAYGKDLTELEEYFRNVDAGLSWNTIDSDIIRGWMETMIDKGNVAASVNRRLSAVRSFFKFALSHGLVDKDPSRIIEGVKKNKRLPVFVKDSEMQELLDETMWDMTKFIDVCARTIIMVFYETGMRLSELTSLDDDAVDFVNLQVKVTGKRSKQRIIPFGEELKKEYCCLEFSSKQQYFFFQPPNGVMSVWGLNIPFTLKAFHFVQIFFKCIRILPQNTSFKQVNIAKERLFLATNRFLC